MTTPYRNAIEKRIQELEQYSPPLTAKPDLHSFWEHTLTAAGSKPLNAVREEAPTPMPWVTAYKVSYEGYDDTPIRGWYLLPKFGPENNLPCVVLYHGYTESSGFPEKYGQWSLAGFAVFAVDIRGQGGETGNHLPQTFGMAKGWITQGITDKESRYYRAITVDAVKALDWVRSQPEIDPSRIAAAGSDQGGGLALMTAALSDVPALAVANIPNMCHMDFGILSSTGSLTEAAQFAARFPGLLEQVLDTLSYFDVLNLADRIRIPVMVSAGLKDTVCMPETVFAAYNRIAGPKLIHTYPFTGHEVVAYQNRRMLEFVRERLSGGCPPEGLA
ncbi:acetylxylan esterase [Paenibacillus sp. P25]|nr:acetylxylan esterase [Paenibacillus sp. P25]